MTIKSKVIKFTTAASFAVAGIATLSAAKLNSLSFNGTAQASTLQAPAKEIGVVKVNSKTGESVAVWNSYEDGKQQTGKYLPHQSSWKTYKKVKTVKGETWYNLGGNQWISSDNVEEEAPIAVTADLSAVATTVSQVPAANVANNNAAQAPAANVNNAQQAATTASVNTASVATTTPVQTNTAANVQQAAAPVAQPATTTTSANTQAAPAQTNYVQTNTAATTKQVSTASTQSNTTYTAPAQQAQPTQQASSQAATTQTAKPQASTQSNTTAKPAQQQAQPTQQASSQAATTQTAKPQASTQSNSSTAQTVVSAAQSQIGKPYVWGATGPNAYDCSGLVQYAYSQAGKNVGRTTYQQAGAGQHISVSQAQAGDILMWGDYHDAIYVGNNQYVHAPQPGQNVTQASISSYFMPDYAIRVN
ncbi:C40 family peptidase [Lactobacillus johnsonii]|uniref:Hydrolase n=1 Tax=Lactobacillus johnsonii TaxID=33959 RepID=A0A9X6P0Q5_LACJH|nr:C40 family peptidase [Lactobacillus johnsonii]OYS02677.1 hydrolase [Lactobacillus johnsonii]OYS06463.1 hydrolase [Lactobacillus johnsonii]OYS07341.1 hydrolase [Lactobacillus johnsonii]OYS10057.1 hydrolase [Lactobacillus johnsonii]OYS11888.1 hydrolase [Lactobacillus johnsonii]